MALAQPEKSARQLAWQFTDQEGYFVSESSVFRLLKRFDLVGSPAFQLVTAADRFAHPTKRGNELWQTDFTYFKIQGGAGITCRPCWMTTPATSWRGSRAL
jgi:transposase InsO family protein